MGISIEFRTVRREFEARLTPPDAGKASGKIEWKVYGNGNTRLKLSARNLDGGANFAVQLFVDGVSVGETVASHGRVRWDINTRDGDRVPDIHDGQLAELRAGGAVLLRGVFEPD